MALRAVVLVAALVHRVSAANCSDSDPFLEMIVEPSPKCIEGCPQLCEPLGALITEFMMSGDEVAMGEMVCEAKEHFDCLFKPSNFHECQKILANASAMGTRLPMSQEEFDQSCALFTNSSVSSVRDFLATSGLRGGATTEVATTVAATTEVTTIAPKVACTGDDAMVQGAMRLSPQCFTSCPHLCGAMETLAAQYAELDREAIEQQVCAGKEEFSCMLQPSNLAACEAVLSAGASFNVPQTEAELSRQCSTVAGDSAHDIQPDMVPSTAAPLGCAVFPVLLLWLALQSA